MGRRRAKQGLRDDQRCPKHGSSIVGLNAFVRTVAETLILCRHTMERRARASECSRLIKRRLELLDLDTSAKYHPGTQNFQPHDAFLDNGENRARGRLFEMLLTAATHDVPPTRHQ